MKLLDHFQVVVFLCTGNNVVTLTLSGNDIVTTIPYSNKFPIPVHVWVWSKHDIKTKMNKKEHDVHEQGGKVIGSQA